MIDCWVQTFGRMGSQNIGDRDAGLDLATTTFGLGLELAAGLRSRSGCRADHPDMVEPMQLVTVNVDAEAGSTPTTSEAVRAPPNSTVPAKSVLRYFFRLVVINPAPSAPGVLPHTPP